MAAFAPAASQPFSAAVPDHPTSPRASLVVDPRQQSPQPQPQPQPPPPSHARSLSLKQASAPSHAVAAAAEQAGAMLVGSPRTRADQLPPLGAKKPLLEQPQPQHHRPGQPYLDLGGTPDWDRFVVDGSAPADDDNDNDAAAVWLTDAALRNHHHAAPPHVDLAAYASAAAEAQRAAMVTRADGRLPAAGKPHHVGDALGPPGSPSASATAYPQPPPKRLHSPRSVDAVLRSSYADGGAARALVYRQRGASSVDAAAGDPVFPSRLPTAASASVAAPVDQQQHAAPPRSSSPSSDYAARDASLLEAAALDPQLHAALVPLGLGDGSGRGMTADAAAAAVASTSAGAAASEPLSWSASATSSSSAAGTLASLRALSGSGSDHSFSFGSTTVEEAERAPTTTAAAAAAAVKGQHVPPRMAMAGGKPDAWPPREEGAVSNAAAPRLAWAPQTRDRESRQDWFGEGRRRDDGRVGEMGVVAMGEDDDEGEEDVGDDDDDEQPDDEDDDDDDDGGVGAAASSPSSESADSPGGLPPTPGASSSSSGLPASWTPRELTLASSGGGAALSASAHGGDGGAGGGGGGRERGDWARERERVLVGLGIRAAPLSARSEPSQRGSDAGSNHEAATAAAAASAAATPHSARALSPLLTSRSSVSSSSASTSAGPATAAKLPGGKRQLMLAAAAGAPPGGSAKRNVAAPAVANARAEARDPLRVAPRVPLASRSPGAGFVSAAAAAAASASASSPLVPRGALPASLAPVLGRRTAATGLVGHAASPTTAFATPLLPPPPSTAAAPSSAPVEGSISPVPSAPSWEIPTGAEQRFHHLSPVHAGALPDAGGTGTGGAAASGAGGAGPRGSRQGSASDAARAPTPSERAAAALRAAKESRLGKAGAMQQEEKEKWALRSLAVGVPPPPPSPSSSAGFGVIARRPGTSTSSSSSSPSSPSASAQATPTARAPPASRTAPSSASPFALAAAATKAADPASGNRSRAASFRDSAYGAGSTVSSSSTGRRSKGPPTPLVLSRPASSSPEMGGAEDASSRASSRAQTRASFAGSAEGRGGVERRSSTRREGRRDVGAEVDQAGAGLTVAVATASSEADARQRLASPWDRSPFSADSGTDQYHTPAESPLRSASLGSEVGVEGAEDSGDGDEEGEEEGEMPEIAVGDPQLTVTANSSSLADELQAALDGELLQNPGVVATAAPPHREPLEHATDAAAATSSDSSRTSRTTIPAAAPAEGQGSWPYEDEGDELPEGWAPRDLDAERAERDALESATAAAARADGAATRAEGSEPRSPTTRRPDVAADLADAGVTSTPRSADVREDGGKGSRPGRSEQQHVEQTPTQSMLDAAATGIDAPSRTEPTTSGPRDSIATDSRSAFEFDDSPPAEGKELGDDAGASRGTSSAGLSERYAATDLAPRPSLYTTASDGSSSAGRVSHAAASDHGVAAAERQDAPSATAATSARASPPASVLFNTTIFKESQASPREPEPVGPKNDAEARGEWAVAEAAAKMAALARAATPAGPNSQRGSQPQPQPTMPTVPSRSSSIRSRHSRRSTQSSVSSFAATHSRSNSRDLLRHATMANAEADQEPGAASASAAAAASSSSARSSFANAGSSEGRRGIVDSPERLSQTVPLPQGEWSASPSTQAAAPLAAAGLRRSFRPNASRKRPSLKVSTQSASSTDSLPALGGARSATQPSLPPMPVPKQDPISGQVLGPKPPAKAADAAGLQLPAAGLKAASSSSSPVATNSPGLLLTPDVTAPPSSASVSSGPEDEFRGMSSRWSSGSESDDDAAASSSKSRRRPSKARQGSLGRRSTKSSISGPSSGSGAGAAGSSGATSGGGAGGAGGSGNGGGSGGGGGMGIASLGKKSTALFTSLGLRKKSVSKESGGGSARSESPMTMASVASTPLSPPGFDTPAEFPFPTPPMGSLASPSAGGGSAVSSNRTSAADSSFFCAGEQPTPPMPPPPGQTQPQQGRRGSSTTAPSDSRFSQSTVASLHGARSNTSLRSQFLGGEAAPAPSSRRPSISDSSRRPSVSDSSRRPSLAFAEMSSSAHGHRATPSTQRRPSVAAAAASDVEQPTAPTPPVQSPQRDTSVATSAAAVTPKPAVPSPLLTDAPAHDGVQGLGISPQPDAEEREETHVESTREHTGRDARPDDVPKTKADDGSRKPSLPTPPPPPPRRAVAPTMKEPAPKSQEKTKAAPATVTSSEDPARSSLGSAQSRAHAETPATKATTAASSSSHRASQTSLRRGMHGSQSERSIPHSAPRPPPRMSQSTTRSSVRSVDPGHLSIPATDATDETPRVAYASLPASEQGSPSPARRAEAARAAFDDDGGLEALGLAFIRRNDSRRGGAGAQHDRKARDGDVVDDDGPASSSSPSSPGSSQRSSAGEAEAISTLAASTTDRMISAMPLPPPREGPPKLPSRPESPETLPERAAEVEKTRPADSSQIRAASDAVRPAASAATAAEGVAAGVPRRRPQYPSLSDLGREWIRQNPHAPLLAARGYELRVRFAVADGGQRQMEDSAATPTSSDSGTDDYGSSDGGGNGGDGGGAGGGGQGGDRDVASPGGGGEGMPNGSGRDDGDGDDRRRAPPAGGNNWAEQGQAEDADADESPASEDDYGSDGGDENFYSMSNAHDTAPWRDEERQRSGASSSSSSDDVPLALRVDDAAALQKRLRDAERRRQIASAQNRLESGGGADGTAAGAPAGRRRAPRQRAAAVAHPAALEAPPDSRPLDVNVLTSKLAQLAMRQGAAGEPGAASVAPLMAAHAAQRHPPSTATQHPTSSGLGTHASAPHQPGDRSPSPSLRTGSSNPASLDAPLPPRNLLAARGKRPFFSSAMPQPTISPKMAAATQLPREAQPAPTPSSGSAPLSTSASAVAAANSAAAAAKEQMRQQQMQQQRFLAAQQQQQQQQQMQRQLQVNQARARGDSCSSSSRDHAMMRQGSSESLARAAAMGVWQPRTESPFSPPVAALMQPKRSLPPTGGATSALQVDPETKMPIMPVSTAAAARAAQAEAYEQAINGEVPDVLGRSGSQRSRWPSAKLTAMAQQFSSPTVSSSDESFGPGLTSSSAASHGGASTRNAAAAAAATEGGFFQGRMRSLSRARGPPPTIDTRVAPPMPHMAAPPGRGASGTSPTTTSVPLPSGTTVDAEGVASQRVHSSASGSTQPLSPSSATPSMAAAAAGMPPPTAQLVQHRIYVQTLQRYGTALLPKAARARELVTSMLEQDLVPAQENVGGWVAFDVSAELGIERPLREYEVVSEVVEARAGAKDYFIIKRTELAPYLSLRAIPASSPVLAGWVYVQEAKRKWTKRWLELREHSLFHAKSEKGKDEVLVCHLSAFDVYLVDSSRVKTPKAHAFAIRSQNKITMFERPEQDYAHFFSLSDPAAHRDWVRAIMNARTYVLSRERAHLLNYRPPPRQAPPGVQAAQPSGSATATSASAVQAQAAPADAGDAAAPVPALVRGVGSGNRGVPQASTAGLSRSGSKRATRSSTDAVPAPPALPQGAGGIAAAAHASSDPPHHHHHSHPHQPHAAGTPAASVQPTAPLITTAAAGPFAKGSLLAAVAAKRAPELELSLHDRSAAARARQGQMPPSSSSPSAAQEMERKARAEGQPLIDLNQR